MGQGISNRAFAELMGVSEGAVRNSKPGRVQRHSDGSIDVDASKSTWIRSADPARIKPRTDTQTLRSKPIRGPAVRTEDDARAAIALVARVLQEEGADAGPIDYNAARTADTILKAHERDLKMAQRRKELVPMAQVKTHVGRAFVGFRQSVQRLPSRHVPAMAAELECDPGMLESLLNKAIAAELDALSVPVVRT